MLLIVILGLAVYAQTFAFGFVFDDLVFIVNNPYIKNFTAFTHIWTSFPMTRFVGMLSFACNYAVNQLHPSGYHIFNFLVHIAATGMVLACSSLLFKITDAKNTKGSHWAPLTIALIFLVHPCQTQAVTYVSQRFESMATVFYLSAFYCYLKGRLSSGVQRTVLFYLAVLCAVAGIMTKEVVVTVPVMLLAAEWILWPQSFKKIDRRIVVFGVIAAVAFGLLFTKLVKAGVGVFFVTIPSESHDGDVITAGKYMLTQLRVFLTFVKLLVFPVHQNLDYDYPLSTGIFSPLSTAVGALLVTGIIAAIIRLRRAFPLIALGLAWMLITFSINLVPRANVIFEHKLYLISFGFILAVVAALDARVRDKRIAIGISAVIIATLALTAFYRNQVWRNEQVLWEDVVAKSPAKSRAYGNLGRVYGERNRSDDAIHALTKAITLGGDNDIVYANRGAIYVQQGHLDLAVEDFDKAIAINPRYFLAYVRRAEVYKIKHDDAAALRDLSQAIALEPHFEAAYIKRGLLKMEHNQLKDALQDLDQALAIDPYNYEALLYRGVIYFYMDRYADALNDFNRAQQVDPSQAIIYKNRAYCLLKMGRTKEADQDFMRIGLPSPSRALK